MLDTACKATTTATVTVDTHSNKPANLTHFLAHTTPKFV
jgi:hypothetical protein